MSSRRGGLLELVARGKKDLYFTSNPKVAFFHSVYPRAAPFVEEVYISQPRNNAEWGRWVEFEYEHRGDLVRKMFLRINLPTWLPDSVAAINATSVLTDASGVSYGYCNNIGYQVIDKIQFYQDQVIVQELYGEYMDWRMRQSNSLSSAYVLAASTGSRNETPIAIGRAATPGLLRVPIPLIGAESVGDVGFPMVAMRKQRFRIRILLRNLEELIVASDNRINPNPFSMPLHIQKTRTGPIDTSEITLPRSTMNKKIDIALETTRVYVQKDVQEWLRIQKWLIPYRQIQYQEFTIEDNQWNAAATASVTNFSLPFRVDFIGPASRLLVALQREGARMAGQRTILLADAIRNLRIMIANINRIQQFDSTVFKEFTAYWKNMRSSQNLADLSKTADIFTLVFGGKDSPNPAGTLNLTRAVQPELWATLAPIEIDMRTKSRKAFLIVYAETWRIWEIQNELGKSLIDE
jgi:hypothetical protein